MNRNFEKKLYTDGKEGVIGIDEVGRGCIAGPVVCAAVYIPPSAEQLQSVRDSKRIKKESEREEIYSKLLDIPGIEWYASVIPHDRIDEINILNATMLGMETAGLRVASDRDVNWWFLVDGNRVPKGLTGRATSVVKGDDTEYVIAAASIIAKVTRDRLMNHYDEIYPNYGFSSHKGYGTKRHVQAINKFGVTDIHRMSFAPCKNLKNIYS